MLHLGEESKKRASLVADLKAAVEFAEMKKLSPQSVRNEVGVVWSSWLLCVVDELGNI